MQKDFKKLDLSAINLGKLPPQAKELEEVVLGTCMDDANAYDIAAEILQPEYFYLDKHQRIFRAFQRLAERYVRCEIFSVIEELSKTKELEEIGGAYVLTMLRNKAAFNHEDNCRILLQKHIGREMIRISGETIVAAYDETTDCFDLVDEHESKLVSLSSGFLKGNFETSASLAMKFMDKTNFLRENREQLSGVPTGFKPLDRLTNGWQPTDLIILAARPSVGKTAFALNLARNAATSKIKRVPVAFFSLEMSSAQITQRMISTESKIYMDKITRGRMEDYEMVQLAGASERFSKMPIYIDDTAALNIFELRAKARRLVSKFGVGLIIIDYLQLMQGMDKKSGNREQEVANISRNLKALAKQLNIPIIALSQLSRNIETRKEKPEPQLSDLRESGAIEQDADMVMFLYRPDYQMQPDEVDPSIRGEAIGKIAKHRNGGLEKIPFKTDLSIQSWTDVEIQPVFGSSWKPVLEDTPF